MKLAEASSKRPIAILMLLTAVVFLGIISFQHLKLDLLPQIEYPYAVVITTYMGAGTEEVEELVTIPLEKYISSTPGVRRFTSMSMDSVSFIIVEFNWNVKTSDAVGRLSRYIDLAARELPEGVKPIVVEFDPSLLPVYAFSTEENYEEVVSHIRRLSDVASVEELGKPRKVVEIVLNHEKIKKLDVDPSLIETLLSGNLVYPFGYVEDSEGNIYPVSVDGRFKSLEDLKNTIVGFRGVKYQSLLRGDIPKLLVPVRLKNIADVKITEENVQGEIRVNGKKASLVAVYKRSGANTVKTVREIKKILKNSGINYVEAVNQAYYTERAIDNLLKNLFYGFIAAFIVVLIFLKDFTSTFVTSFSIPLSLTVTFVFLYAFGINLDTLTLGGLIMALGMLVDNSIVVFENIYRHRSQGKPIPDAAREGTSEVWVAILASTLTTVSVFLPVVFFTGFVVRLFKYFALAFALALFSSLFVSTVIVPAGTRWIKPKKGRMTEKLQRSYRKALEWCLERKSIVLTVAIALVIISAMFLLSKPLGFIPTFQTNLVVIDMKLPPQASYKKTAEAVRVIEDYLNTYRLDYNITSFYSEIGVTSEYSQLMGRGQNEARIMVNLGGSRKEFGRNRERLKKDISSLNISGAKVEVLEQSQQIYEILGYPITIEVRGDNLEVIQRKAEEIYNSLKAIPEIEKVQIRDSYKKNVMHIEIDRNKALMNGVVAGQVFLDLQTYLLGKTLGTLKTSEGTLPIILRKSESLTVEYLPKIPLGGLKGDVPLGTIASISQRDIPSVIDHSDGERVAYVDVVIAEGSLGNISKKVEETLEKLDLSGVKVDLSGQKIFMDEALSELRSVVYIAISLVYMILAAQFESFVLPFVIFLTVPFAIVGVAFAVLINNYSLDVPVLVGLLTLSGTVVNNAIVMLTRIEQIRKDKDLKESILEGAQGRLRPILMTTFTTIVALLPTALSHGEGAEIESPISWVVIFGMLISMLFTLFVIPVIYSLFRRKIKV
ncbi:efflux RND transporter permease subunit [Thermotoga sp. KOL6]|uniref:efflux RND transporter permease subunit n=1 Tax=Thermotoga sp. KOL6 TaxID=126741 RepID=UPI000C75E432|nr:efflux RND transporter permease subunit [Thermotoga sp. KOL6]PLV59109.1 cation transporter [Thermotoga sp. KOL6]